MSAPQRLNLHWRVLAAIVIVAVNLVRWRVIVRGLGNVPRRSGAVVVFNHHSYVDFLLVSWPIVRRLRRPLRFLAKREIWSSRWTGWVVRSAGAVPVDRESVQARSGAFDAMIEALSAGDLVAIAPEQTISPSLELLPFRTGAVRAAQQAGVPVIPTVGWGSQRFATKGAGRRLVTGIPVIVRFGEPIWVAPDDDPIEVTDRLQAVMTELLHQEQEHYPDGAPAGAPWVPARLGGGAPHHAEVLAEHRRRAEQWEHGSGEPGRDEPGAAAS